MSGAPSMSEKGLGQRALFGRNAGAFRERRLIEEALGDLGRRCGRRPA